MSGRGRTALAVWIGRTLGPPRFMVFLATLAATAVGWHFAFPAHAWRDALAMGFDLAAVVALATMLPMLRETDLARMKQRAGRDVANRGLALVLTAVVMLVVMATLTVELKGARSGHPLAIARMVGTLMLIWLFGNSVFTLHYAHAFYAPDKPAIDVIEHADVEAAHKSPRCDWAGGLDFPGTPEPQYSDFAYFAFTLGMTFQTSDTSITAPSLRRVVTLHSFVAFLFNIGIIAFSINALGGIS